MNKPEFYISAASTISHLPTFRNAGFSSVIGPLEANSALITPDYKSYIEAALLRRMSKILRMSVACSKDCLEQAGVEQPDAIVVGTGLGCLQDTEKFLNTSQTVEGLLPPTAFIQSTHNTMAGQVSLTIGNHGYNMTHTQNTLSFEHAMLDAMMLLQEGDSHILVGAADEYIEVLTEIMAQLAPGQDRPMTSGASFFVLSKEKNEQVMAAVRDVVTIGLADDVQQNVGDFLADNALTTEDLDLILYAGQDNFPGQSAVDYLTLSGIYATASAFALHYAVDVLQTDKKIKNVLICNSLRKSNLGLMLVQAVEA